MLSIVTAVGATGVGGRWAGNRCLQMLAHQPGPMGGEVCELIKQRDPESPLLRCRHTLSTMTVFDMVIRSNRVQLVGMGCRQAGFPGPLTCAKSACCMSAPDRSNFSVSVEPGGAVNYLGSTSQQASCCGYDYGTPSQHPDFDAS